jgi:hypothetical protein
MGYIIYSITFGVLVVATGTPLQIKALDAVTDDYPALYVLRARWLPLFPVHEYIYSRLPSSFAGDIEAGFSSEAFDLASNVSTGDSRAGLDEQGKKEVRRIMRTRRVDFDEARRLYTEQRFSKNNIGPDGRPRDPKFVSFS